MQELIEKLTVKEVEHEQVFQKEVFVLRNDLYYRFYEHRHDRWFVDISFKPKQKPGGDVYSIRKLDETRMLVFLVDAMGKGITASITSILSAAFINHYIDKEREGFELLSCVREYHDYIKELLFEEEAVSCAFLLLDFEQNTLESAMFGMPPILLCDEQEQVTRLRANNFPLTRHTETFNTNRRSIEHIYKILLYTDGLNETIVDERVMYRKFLDDDFRRAPNYKHFLQTVQRRMETFDDDMTLVFLERERCSACQVKSLFVPSQRSMLDRAIVETEAYFASHGLSGKELGYMMQAFTEVLFNAYEHGNLQIDYQTKRRLLEEGSFERHNERQEEKYGEKRIKIQLHVKDESHLKTFKIDMTDEGEGFDTALMRNRIINKAQFNGRGLLMVSKLVDAYYYSEKGNRVILKKFIPKEKQNG